MLNPSMENTRLFKSYPTESICLVLGMGNLEIGVLVFPSKNEKTQVLISSLTPTGHVIISKSFIYLFFKLPVCKMDWKVSLMNPPLTFYDVYVCWPAVHLLNSQAQIFEVQQSESSEK